MTKINRCLKGVFLSFNALFAILGVLLVIGAVKSSTYNHQLSAVGSPNLAWSWVFALGVLGISLLGIYAGSSEKQLPLKIFAGFMALGMVIMLIFGIIVVVARSKAKANLYNASSENIQPLMADQEVRELLETLQRTDKCCGVVSASDWGNSIPYSCQCSSGGGFDFSGYGNAECTSKPQGARGPDSVYKKNCTEFIMEWANFFFNIAMGMCFGFAVTALLGLLASLLMIHQVRRYDGSGHSSMAMKGY